ncbi:MAG: hypothetical protein NW223_05220 [Hyphomicrobiaceae bacterium]|nr:hypothetical protein [Hyphomicrobiaceae bacterium]
MYERLERLAQSPAARLLAPFLVGGALMLAAFADDTARALQAGGIVSLLAALVLMREAGSAGPEAADAAAIARELYGAAIHAALFAISFFLAALAMGLAAPA